MRKTIRTFARVSVGVAGLAVALQLELAPQIVNAEVRPNQPEDVVPRATTDDPPSPPIPPPTPTPTPACPYKKGTMDVTGWDRQSAPAAPFAGSITTDPCVATWINQARTLPIAWDWPEYYDDGLARNIAIMFFGGESMTGTNTSSEFRGDHSRVHTNRELANGAYCQDSGYHHWDSGYRASFSGGVWSFRNAFCVSGYFYFDAACNLVRKSVVDAVCRIEPPTYFKFSFIKSSPISLMWSPDADIENAATVSTFPLNPEKPNAFYAWRASDDTPLLVYDPSHKGEIKSAEQLFGNWTFGGQRSASLANTGETLGRPWKNGYEALATLDRNKDGKLTDEELKALALWFDSNRDAVSQPGEVKSLADVGVTTVYVTPDNGHSNEQHVFASRGFERTVNGKKVSGASVDWFAESADTPFELTAGLALSKLGSAKGKAPALPQTDESDVQRNAVQAPGLAGVWQWSFDDPRQAGELSLDTTGLLVFGTRTDKNDINGWSLVVSRFEKTPNDTAAGRTSVLYLIGKQNGKKVSFAPLAGPQGTTLTSEAILSDDSTTLKGTTTASWDSDTGLKQLTYQWTARKQ